METARKYLEECGRSKWLFLSWDEGKYLTTWTVEKIFSNAYKNADAKKNAMVHFIIHIFVTHLLERGIDMQYI